MTKALTCHFQQRGALAVLTGCSLDTTLSLNSYLTKLIHPSSDCKPFSAHISLGMEQNAFLGLQLVQTLSPPCQLSPSAQPLCSLVNTTVLGLQLSSLIQRHTQKVVGEEQSQSSISSLQLSLQGSCSSLQLSLAAQLSPEAQTPPYLPNLLTCSSRLEAMLGSSPGLYSLLEAGCHGPSCSTAAKIVTQEVSSKAVLTWEHVESVDSDGRRTTSHQREEVNNMLALSVTLPRVWADVAAPQTGRHSLSTGEGM